jgi:hypothetical protein
MIKRQNIRVLAEIAKVKRDRMMTLTYDYEIINAQTEACNYRRQDYLQI